MASRSAPAGLTGLLLVASVAALRPPYSSIREQPPSICGFAHYGSAVGSAQRLVETHLSPGVADWNIVVPMPPPCADAQVTGVDMRVCDADAQPDVSMSDVRSARVHRAGSLAGFAAVNVTVYCILPPEPPPPSFPPALPPPFSEPPTQLSYPTDSSSTDEVSNELNSYELSSNEEMSDESIVSASIEQTTTVKPILSTTTTVKPTMSTTTTVKPTSSTTTTVKPTSSTTSPPILEETTARVVLALPTKVVTHPSDNTTRPKGEKPQSIQVTINITPTNQMSTEDGESHAYDVKVPLLSNIEKKNEVMPSHSPSFSSVPYKATPPRFVETPPQKHVRHPSRPGRPLHRPPPRSLPLQPAPGAPGPPLYPPAFASRASFAAPPSYPLAPLYRPLGLLDPRLRFLQYRQPHIFFRQF